MKRFSAIAPAVVIMAGLYLISLYNYLLFHSLVEFFALIIAFGIFMIAWNSRRFIENSYLLFLGISYFFVGVFDIAHTLAFEGMNIFQAEGSNLSTQLWIAGRYLQGISLFIAPFFMGRTVRPPATFLVYAAVSAIAIGSIFAGVFPVCFIENAGLTPFKIISEYLVIAMLIGSVAVLLAYRDRFDWRVLRLIVGSIVCIALSEMALTLYVDIYGIWYLVGYYFKLVSYYLIYRAMIKTGLREPYSLILRDLKQSEERLLAEKNRAETYLNIAGTLFVVTDNSGKVVLINRRGCEILGCDSEKVVGSDWIDTFIPAMDRKEEHAFFSRFLSGPGGAIEYRESAVMTAEDKEKIIAWNHTILNDESAGATVILSSGEDITSRIEYERALEKYQGKLEQLVQHRTGELEKTNNQLMVVSKKLSEAENVERRKIARELHDLVGQNLTALGLNLNLMKAKLASRELTALNKRIKDSISLVEDTTVTIRDVMAKLRPPVLDDYGLLAAIKGYAESFQDRTGIAVVITGDDLPARPDIHTETSLFRIVQETLNNAAKHSGATRVTVSMKQNGRDIALVIEDNGKGFDRDEMKTSKKKKGSWGLANITERALSIGGDCVIESEPGKGTRVVVEVHA